MKIDDIYTNIEDAKKEILKRWNDDNLKNKVEKYLNNNIPDVFLHEPRCVCTAHIASPNLFFSNFYEKSLELGLKPVVFEYLDDIFITTNFDKASLAKMVFYSGKNKNGGTLTTSKHVIDLSGKNEKLKIMELSTLWGQNFVDFHHDITNKYYKNIEIYDGSKWYHLMGKSPEEYYKCVFALYIRNGILFENYLLNNKREKKFIEDVLLPAFEFVYKEFGLKPLIVPLVPREDEDNKCWWCYPEHIKNDLQTNNN